MRTLSGFALVLFLLVGCAKVQFENVGLPETAAPGEGGLISPPTNPENPSRCAGFEQADQSLWLPVGLVQVSCTEACADGSARECRAFQEKEVVCRSGEVVETGKTRFRSEPVPVGSCPVTNLDCGEHSHLSKWWTESGVAQKTCEVCPAGENHICRYAVEVEMSCTNGVISSTSKSREGKFISYENTCRPKPPMACDGHNSDSNWWDVSGVESAACQTCWNGQVLNCEYQHEIEKSCHDGLISQTGQKRKGSLVRTIGQCPAEPKACGNLASGALEWRKTAKTKVTNCEVCPDGSNRQCLIGVEDQYRCDNGSLSSTGATRDGSFLDYVAACPAQFVEKFESVNASAVSGKADVLFILDTSSSMFASLNNLGNRFEQLTSDWGRIDWRLAITNSKVQKHFLESWALDGSPIELQKNDETKPKEFIIKKSERFAENWFYWTISRDPSDNGCQSQPYCMLSPSEPLRALTGAIRKRNDINYSGFFRSNAQLVTVMITDEDERSLGPDEPKAMRPQEAIDYFNQNLGSRMSGLTALSIIIKPGDTTCLKNQSSLFKNGVGGRYARSLEQFAKMTNGLTASLCEKDYGPVLAKLADKIRQQIESITLQETPVLNSLQISFSPNQNITWTLSGRKVTFSRSIPAGVKIQIRYLVKK